MTCPRETLWEDRIRSWGIELREQEGLYMFRLKSSDETKQLFMFVFDFLPYNTSFLNVSACPSKWHSCILICFSPLFFMPAGRNVMDWPYDIWRCKKKHWNPQDNTNYQMMLHVASSWSHHRSFWKNLTKVGLFSIISSVRKIHSLSSIKDVHLLKSSCILPPQ